MEWIHQSGSDFLNGLLLANLNRYLPEPVLMVLSLLVVIGFIAVLSMILIWGERKVAARIQNRVGPMMTGPRAMAEFSMWTGGWLQSPADAIKLLTKELIVPAQADPFPFFLAPVIIVTVCITAFIVVPFAPALSVSDLNIGIVHILAISSLSVLSILMAGYSSNSKYSLLGGLRSAAQMLSYEVPLIFALLGPILLAGTLSMQGIVRAQQELGIWFAIPSFLGFVIYYISSIAEVNRPPFDIPEAESELVAGYVSEYSGIMFSMFFLAEFANMFLVCAVAVTVFLGGWLVPFVTIPDQAQTPFVLLGLASFAIKTSILVFVMMWIRWTFPRVRPDHLMNLGWKYLFPLSLLNLVLCAAVAIFHEEGSAGLDARWEGLAIGGIGVVSFALVLLLLRFIHPPAPTVPVKAPR